MLVSAAERTCWKWPKRQRSRSVAGAVSEAFVRRLHHRYVPVELLSPAYIVRSCFDSNQGCIADIVVISILRLGLILTSNPIYSAYS